MQIDHFPSRWTRWAVAVILASNVFLYADEQAAFPYSAVVLDDDTSVQSGPETDFYATVRLSKGTEVEVYRVDNGHWLAIRPPQDSFSWVAAEHIELTASGTKGRVINTPAKTRVGSEFSDIHDVEYISLNKGEILELLGTKMLTDEETGVERRWFKVAPPSGEFRWIHADSVARIEKNAGAAKTLADTIQTFDLPEQTEALAALSLAKPVDGVSEVGTAEAVQLSRVHDGAFERRARRARGNEQGFHRSGGQSHRLRERRIFRD